MLGLARDHLVQHRDGAVEVALRGVDLGERDGRQRRRRRAKAALVALLPEHARRLRQVEPALDDTGEEVARAAQPPARLGALTLVLRGAPDDLVDELGLREHARPRDAKPLRLLDQLLPRHPLEILPVHRRGPYHSG